MASNPRIGLFLCECGGEISDHVDLSALTERAQAHPDVAYVGTRPFWCSPDGLAEIRALVNQEKLDRVLVAGCSVRTHGNLLRSTAEGAGLNWNFCQIVNLRAHCASVHPDRNEDATRKAERLLRVGIASVSQAEPVELIEAEINPTVAVIGGGIVGMTAALSLARRGIAVKLIDAGTNLGGYLLGMQRFLSGQIRARDFIATRVKAVEDSPNIEVLLNSPVSDITGHIGAFEVKTGPDDNRKSLTAGAVILATGAKEWTPAGQQKADPDTVSLAQLEGMLKDGKVSANRIVMVLSSEGPTSRLPASIALMAEATLESATYIGEARPEASITVIFRDLPESVKETSQNLAASGVRFVRYGLNDPPRISAGKVEVRAEGGGKQETIESDLTVLVTGLVPSEGTLQMGKIAGLWQDENGFLIEPYLRLRSEEALDRGIYVAGTAHGPVGISAAMTQALGAAARAAALIEAGRITKRSLVAVVEEELCRGCGRCEEVCCFDAAKLVDREQGIRKSRIDDVLCVGCGFCASECISGAIRLPFLTDRQLDSMVAAAAEST